MQELDLKAFFAQQVEKQTQQMQAKARPDKPGTLDELDPDHQVMVWPIDGREDTLDIDTIIGNPFLLFGGHFTTLKVGECTYLITAPSKVQTKFALAYMAHHFAVTVNLDSAWIRELDTVSLLNVINNVRKGKE